MCDRCDQPIPPGQEEHVPVHSGSGAGATVIWHRDGCGPSTARPASYPAGLGR